ncbi:MAG: [Fe-Fe] hydrogenase large subunit C-terminal domain-containing protein [Candidatus Dojkabacteria bacterium]|nr:[Fe-Fe] hydrogenase large subunit C-terminal domain-containing protein [Candidatus Dojkabacteria bacterium]
MNSLTSSTLKKYRFVCLLAPSFASEFDYPDIIYRLRKLGFDQVVELTFGAKMINHVYYEILKESIDKKEEKTWIASPCPTLVNFIRVKYPNLVKNLVPVHSPMGAMSLICKKFYPKHKQVFIGPCITKKLEAGEIGTVDYVLTFKELEEMLEENKIPLKITESKYCITFDKFYNDYTKIYPISGGLSDTLHYDDLLKDKDILVLEGLNDIIKVLDNFKDGCYKNYKFLDILNCKGGCINGPGMIGERSVSERRKRILKYRDNARRYEKDLGRAGKKIIVKDIDFRRKF